MDLLLGCTTERLAVVLGLLHMLVWLQDGDDVSPAPDLWNSLAGLAFSVEIPQPVQQAGPQLVVNSGVMLSGPWALPFLSLLTAAFISSSVKAVKRDMSVLGLC